MIITKKLFSEKSDSNQDPSITIFGDRIITVSVSLAVAFLLTVVAILALKFRFLPPQLPIFYSRSWGEAMLAQSVTIWILPVIILLLLILDLLLCRKLAKFNQFLVKIISL